MVSYVWNLRTCVGCWELKICCSWCWWSRICLCCSVRILAALQTQTHGARETATFTPHFRNILHRRIISHDCTNTLSSPEPKIALKSKFPVTAYTQNANHMDCTRHCFGKCNFLKSGIKKEIQIQIQCTINKKQRKHNVLTPNVKCRLRDGCLWKNTAVVFDSYQVQFQKRHTKITTSRKYWIKMSQTWAKHINSHLVFTVVPLLNSHKRKQQRGEEEG